LQGLRGGDRGREPTTGRGKPGMNLLFPEQTGMGGQNRFQAPQASGFKLAGAFGADIDYAHVNNELRHGTMQPRSSQVGPQAGVFFYPSVTF